jgi:hypothetical protein
MPPNNRLAPPLRNSLASYVPAPLDPNMMPPEVQPSYGLRSRAENLSIGLGRGITEQLQGTKQLVTDPVGSVRALVEAARAAGTDPMIILQMLREMRQKAMSGAMGFGEVAGGMLPLGVRGQPPVANMANIPSRFPRVDEIEGIAMGPAGKVKPRVIAENQPLYRETSATNLNDYLRNDMQFQVGGGFVTDDPTLAIGQGINTGVMVQFRPNAVSGAEHAKPGTGVIGGREYVADILAPRAVEKVTFKKEKDLKNLQWLSRKNLAENFTKTVNKDKSITFTRKFED